MSDLSSAKQIFRIQIFISNFDNSWTSQTTIIPGILLIPPLSLVDLLRWCRLSSTHLRVYACISTTKCGTTPNGRNDVQLKKLILLYYTAIATCTTPTWAAVLSFRLVTLSRVYGLCWAVEGGSIGITTTQN